MTFVTLFYLVLAALACILSFYYAFDRLFAVKLSWPVVIVGGIVTSPIIVPVAIACLILDVCGYQYPII